MRAAWLPCLLLALTNCTCSGTRLVGTRVSVVAAPAELDFGPVVVGEARTASVVLSASGVGAVELGAARVDGAPEFSTPFAPEPMEGGSERAVEFRFAPSVEGPFEAAWVLETDAELSPEVRVVLKGLGVRPACVDGDGDRYGPHCGSGPDCDDTRSAVNPGVPEVCGNGLDDDCDPATSDVCPCVDADGDTYGRDCANGHDCDDANAAVHPGAAEACGNGLDDDCDPATGDACPPPCVDGDGDGYGANCTPGPDCDDYKPFVNPGQPERCGNVYDDDCNPATSDDCPVACPAGGCGVGCADGEREAFVDQARYPAIAGCSGGFTVPGVFRESRPACSRGAGDDSANPSGAGCDATDLCAQGWHVCRHVGEVAAKSVDGCAEPDARAGLFFATRQSGPGCGQCATGIDPAVQCAGDDCRTSCYPNDRTSNDLFGCGGAGTTIWGSSCGVLTKFSNNGCTSLPAHWSCPGSAGTDEALVVVKPGPDGGGVLCCAD